MKKGVFAAVKKDGSVYYRASITFRCKHISLAALPQNLRHTVRTNLPISCYLQQYRSHQKIIRKHNFLCSLFQNGSAY